MTDQATIDQDAEATAARDAQLAEARKPDIDTPPAATEPEDRSKVEDLDAKLAELEAYTVQFLGKTYGLRPYTSRLAYERTQMQNELRHIGAQVLAKETEADEAYNAGDLEKGRELQKESTELEFQGEVKSDEMVALVLVDAAGEHPPVEAITDTMPVAHKRRVVDKMSELYVAAQTVADGEREKPDDAPVPTSSASTDGSATG